MQKSPKLERVTVVKLAGLRLPCLIGWTEFGDVWFFDPSVARWKQLR